MTLKQPFTISSRLMPAIEVGGATISIEPLKERTSDQRIRFHWIWDHKGRAAEGTDLSSGCCQPYDGQALQSAFKALFSFLSACGESLRYHGEPTEDTNTEILPVVMHDWLIEHSGEIDMISSELEETTETLIEA